MKKKQYTPQPIDTSDTQLPDDLMQLAEMIAKNVHDVWAKARIEQGWTYGIERNDAKKTTPCLVEYEELTDQEKAYDRNTALETLRLIQKLGFKIIK